MEVLKNEVLNVWATLKERYPKQTIYTDIVEYYYKLILLSLKWVSYWKSSN